MTRLELVKEQIRLRVPLSQIVEKLTGQRISRGKTLCPFHTEKTPSFTVDDDKGLYYCHGCGAGGDIFTFVMRDQGLSFADAVKFIDTEFALGLMDGTISVAAQVAMRQQKEKRALEEKRKAESSNRYDKLCAKYRIYTTMKKVLDPLSEAWGKCIWKIDWLEYAMEEEMSALK